MPPIHLGKKLRSWTPKTVESQLIQNKVLVGTPHQWSDTAFTEGIFLDLSSAEWGEIGALGQLILLTESAFKNGISIILAPPLCQARHSEQEFIQHNPTFSRSIQKKVTNRSRASNFFTHIGLYDAILKASSPFSQSTFRVIENYDLSLQDTITDLTDHNLFEDKLGTDDPVPAHERKEYTYCVPFTWISGLDDQAFESTCNQMINVLHNIERGMRYFDAAVIRNVILFELLENVSVHATTASNALLAVWARPGYLPYVEEEFLPAEVPFLTWLNGKDSAVLEVLIGDSGLGIPNVLRSSFRKISRNTPINILDVTSENPNIVLWAFNRWSTSLPNRDRGTRGLYRVDRILRKYQGLVTVRTDDFLAGWDHGGAQYDRPIYQSRLSSFPGSLIHLRIPTDIPGPAGRQGKPALSTKPSITFLDIGPLGPDGLSAEQRAQVINALSQPGQDSNRLLLLYTPPHSVIPSSVQELKQSNDSVLRELISVRHPTALAIFGLPGDDDFLETIVHSINSDLELKNYQTEYHQAFHFTTWDPVLLITNSGRPFWVGVTPTIGAILSDLTTHGALSSTDISALVPDPALRSDLYRTLRNEPNLVIVNEDASLQMVHSISSIDHICSSVHDTVSSGPASRKGV